MTMQATALSLSRPQWEKLQEAQSAYRANVSESYDEVLHDVAGRVSHSGSIGKCDIGALMFWKRLRADTPWVRDLMGRPEQEVRGLTEKAVAAVRDRCVAVPAAASAGRSALSPLPGLDRGDALASALLLAAAPERMAVYDSRAQRGLEWLGLSLSAARGRYGRYMHLVEGLRSAASAQGHTWTARDVDTALYWLGGQ